MCLIKQCECCSLDWIFAHDAIIFAHNMLMHCTSFFFPPLFLSFAFYYVSYFLFLSLFSFLSLAPKKSIPSKNPISCCSSSSSSSSPFIPDSVRFRDEKAKQDFYENFSDLVIHSKRQVILSNFPNTPLLGAFSSWG